MFRLILLALLSGWLVLSAAVPTLAIVPQGPKASAPASYQTFQNATGDHPVFLKYVTFETTEARYEIDVSGQGIKIPARGDSALKFSCPGFEQSTLRELHFIPRQNELLTVALLSPEEPGADYKYEMTLWDTATMKPKWSHPVSNPDGDLVRGCSFEDAIFFASGDTVTRYEWATGKQVWTTELRKPDKIITASISIGFSIDLTQKIVFQWSINDIGHPLYVCTLDGVTGKVLNVKKQKRKW
ncbi:MAG TPA: hypothetical protein PLS70_23270 [Acidobacteriota bacterium]|nr:hypothetical protein [Acidobacteriota bacterium]